MQHPQKLRLVRGRFSSRIWDCLKTGDPFFAYPNRWSWFYENGQKMGYPLFLDRPMRQGDPQHLAACSSMILSWYGFNVTLKRHLLHTTWTKTPDLPQRKVDTAAAISGYCHGQRCELPHQKVDTATAKGVSHVATLQPYYCHTCCP